MATTKRGPGRPKGSKNKVKGHKFSVETRRKMSLAHKARWAKRHDVLVKCQPGSKANGIYRASARLRDQEAVQAEAPAVPILCGVTALTVSISENGSRIRQILVACPTERRKDMIDQIFDAVKNSVK